MLRSLARKRSSAVLVADLVKPAGVTTLDQAGCDLAAIPPTWAFHGAKDDTVPLVHIEGPMDKIRACDGAESVDLGLTVYPDADHDAWSRTYDLSAGHDIYAWLVEHTTG